MSEYTFKVDLAYITELECFKEASKDELKVIIALASLGDALISLEELSDMLEISKGRVAAAIALFEESGVLTKNDGTCAEVEYEFKPKRREEMTALEAADSMQSSGTKDSEMRDKDLEDLYKQMEIMLEKTLETRESARISYLYKEIGLSAAYILQLANFLHDTRMRFTVETLIREAENLIKNGVNTLEELEIYVAGKSKEIKGEKEIIYALGIRNRTVSAAERKFFQKWLHEYGYGIKIIEEAYSISTVAIGKISLPYMDSILTGWYEKGCKTLEECRAESDVHKHNKTQSVKKSRQKSKKTAEAETPKYTDFNSEDALLRALERSYGESGDN